MIRTILAAIVLVLSLSTIVGSYVHFRKKMHLDEGMKVLNNGDITGALMHLHMADKILGKGS